MINHLDSYKHLTICVIGKEENIHPFLIDAIRSKFPDVKLEIQDNLFNKDNIHPSFHVIIFFIDGFELSFNEIQSLKEKYNNVPILALTDKPDNFTKVLSLNGLFIVKNELNYLQNNMTRQSSSIIEHISLYLNIADQKQKLFHSYGSDFITVNNEKFIVADESSKKLYSKAARIATSKSSVLILGESGVGKDNLARYIHENSKRRGSFASENCALFSKELAQSVLFGHVKSAFTGAENDHIGIFERCNHGTVFLDEIGSLDYNVQSMLLRFIETKKFKRLGGTNEIETDIRLITATNETTKIIDSKEFRQDLLYRIGTIRLKIQPLNSRPNDLSLLIHHFILHFNKQHNKSIVFTPAAIDYLKSLKYPGNIRSLMQVIENGILLYDIEVTVEDIKEIVFELQ